MKIFLQEYSLLKCIEKLRKRGLKESAINFLRLVMSEQQFYKRFNFLQKSRQSFESSQRSISTCEHARIGRRRDRSRLYLYFASLLPTSFTLTFLFSLCSHKNVKFTFVLLRSPNAFKLPLFEASFEFHFLAFEDSGGSGLDEDEIAPAVERTPLRRNTRSLSSPMLVKSYCILSTSISIREECVPF